ncbi:uncharacterized protein [Nicotiana tomentosiformis]|uniref:uncharacterized protein n=1 Tax=Nicotiana tomentosiformis TaxID=4098 RepID=UPI00388C9C95
MVKQALAAWRDSYSESESEDDQGDTSVMAIENESSEYDSIFALMAKSDNDEDKEEDEVNFFNIQRNLKIYSQKKLMSLANVLIDAYHSLINEKKSLTEEISDVKQERDDMVVTILNLKEQVEEVTRENILLKNQMEKWMNNPKGKEAASEAQLDLDNELKKVKTSLATELEKNRELQEDLKKAGVRGNNHRWYMDNGCSKYMTRRMDDFLSLTAFQGGSVSFKNGKKGYILGVEKIDKILFHTIKNVYYVNGLKYSVFSVSQIYEKGNEAKRLGHANFTLLNKLIKKDLVHGLPKSKFKDHKVCDTCAKGKQVRGEKKYIFVIVDDYSRFTWTLFLRTKDEIFPVFVAFVRQIQVNLGNHVVSIRSNHGTEFDNAKFDKFYAENGISHIFSAPRTPQQNGVVEMKNKTLEYMARTMLIDSDVPKYFWAEVVNTAYYLINRCMIRSLLEKTPYELINGRKPKLTYLRAFGYKFFVLNHGKKVLGKMYAKESHESSGKGLHKKKDKDGDFSKVPGEAIDISNEKIDLMSQVKKTDEEDAAESPAEIEEPSPSITSTEAEHRVTDGV